MVGDQDDFAVSGAAATVAELLTAGEAYDLVLLDLALGDGSRPGENVRALRARGIPVLVYTVGDEPSLIREAAAAGAMGMVHKTETPRNLIAAIRAVLSGEVGATADWAAALDTDEDFVAAGLTAREAQVLGLYASGETAERVAQELFISRETVLDHLRRIRAKYAAIDRPAPNKLDLYHRAVEDGIVRRR